MCGLDGIGDLCMMTAVWIMTTQFLRTYAVFSLGNISSSPNGLNDHYCSVDLPCTLSH
jgi:hypothetical protein